MNDWEAFAGFRCLPVPAKYIDKSEDCCYPAPISLTPSFRAEPRVAKVLGFSFVRGYRLDSLRPQIVADMVCFGILDENGALWVWGNEHSGFPVAPSVVIDSGVRFFSLKHFKIMPSALQKSKYTSLRRSSTLQPVRRLSQHCTAMVVCRT